MARRAHGVAEGIPFTKILPLAYCYFTHTPYNSSTVMIDLSKCPRERLPAALACGIAPCVVSFALP